MGPTQLLSPTNKTLLSQIEAGEAVHFKNDTNYLLTYDSYVPLYNRFHRGEWITRVSGGEGALDTPGPLNGTSEASAIWAQEWNRCIMLIMTLDPSWSKH
jgi:hypothetical protein